MLPYFDLLISWQSATKVSEFALVAGLMRQVRMGEANAQTYPNSRSFA